MFLHLISLKMDQKGQTKDQKVLKMYEKAKNRQSQVVGKNHDTPIQMAIFFRKNQPTSSASSVVRKSRVISVSSVSTVRSVSIVQCQYNSD